MRIGLGAKVLGPPSVPPLPWRPNAHGPPDRAVFPSDERGRGEAAAEPRAPPSPLRLAAGGASRRPRGGERGSRACRPDPGRSAAELRLRRREADVDSICPTPAVEGEPFPRLGHGLSRSIRSLSLAQWRRAAR